MGFRLNSLNSVFFFLCLLQYEIGYPSIQNLSLLTFYDPSLSSLSMTSGANFIRMVVFGLDKPSDATECAVTLFPTESRKEKKKVSLNKRGKDEKLLHLPSWEASRLQNTFNNSCSKRAAIQVAHVPRH